MTTIEVSATDVTRLKVILAAMKKGKWELEGEEVLAFAQGFSWAAEMHEKIKKALEPVNKIEPVKTEEPKKGKR
jgi:hypothetical protein